ncbi:hypothetical protein DRP05_13760 [Archaeoglobales archaeon]|nr:MAG: hypothetical protein DRP05_13760 [Archaeoglobales archaeon]
MSLAMFVGILFVIIGVLTYIFRNTPNPYIGVRLGYTYLSKEAWKKANTFTAFYCILFGILLMFTSFTIQLPDNTFILLMLVGVLPMVVITYRIAKESYEREDMRMPMDEAKPLEKADVKNHFIMQIALIVVYLLIVLVCWDKLPNIVATHFDIHGNANGFMDRFKRTCPLNINTTSTYYNKA